MVRKIEGGSGPGGNGRRPGEQDASSCSKRLELSNSSLGGSSCKRLELYCAAQHGCPDSIPRWQQW